MPSDALQTGTESSIILIFLFAPRHLGQSCHTRIKHILHLIERRHILRPQIGLYSFNMFGLIRTQDFGNRMIIINFFQSNHPIGISNFLFIDFRLKTIEIHINIRRHNDIISGFRGMNSPFLSPPSKISSQPIIFFPLVFR